MQRSKKNGLPLLAIDLGGTKILAALISAEGKILTRKQTPTLAGGGAQPVISRRLSAQAVRIVSSQLGDDAGVLDAAVFACQQGDGRGGQHEGS